MGWISEQLKRFEAQHVFPPLRSLFRLWLDVRKEKSEQSGDRPRG